MLNKNNPLKSHQHYIVSRILPILVILLVFVLLQARSAHAGATFGAYTGPFWTNPGYSFTIAVTSLTDPHEIIGLSYTVNGGTAQCSDCVCTSPNCDPAAGTGTWACSIPVNNNTSTITWDISAYSEAACTGTKIQGPADGYVGSPTAIRLSTLSASSAGLPPVQIGASIFLLVVAGVVLLRRRRAA